MLHTESAMETCEDRREHWFDVYMTTFVLLNNIERQLSHSHAFAEKIAANGNDPTALLSEGCCDLTKALLAHSLYHLPVNAVWPGLVL